MKMLVSIIVPCYNSSQTISETLNSILLQSYSEWECIVVNDGSIDNSDDIIKKFLLKDSRFIYIYQENQGVIVARNNGIKISSGKYILPLDSDDLIENNFLEKCIHCFKENPELKLVYTNGILFGAESGLWNLPQYSFKKMLYFNMVGNTSMYLRVDFDRVGGYRENMVHGFEDWDFWIALLSIYDDNQVYKIEEPLFHYRVSNSSRRLTLQTSIYSDQMQQNIVYNNFKVYNSHFTDIHNRIISFDYNSKMMQKWPVSFLVYIMNVLHKLKMKLIK